MQSYLDIKGMTCGACVARVTSALLAVPGVQKVAVDLATRRASVEGDPLSVVELCAAVEQAGYAAIDTSNEPQRIQQQDSPVRVEAGCGSPGSGGGCCCG